MHRFLSSPFAASFLLLACLFAAASCTGPTTDSDSTANSSQDADAAPAVERVLALADAYVDGYYRQFPEEAYEVGYPGVPLDRLGDHSPESRAAWAAQEDAWLEELQAIDPASLVGTEAQVPYAFTRERLEASIAKRACRIELWNVSPAWTGWQSTLAATFSQQPVADADDHAAALSRARDVARFLDVEVANLREGLDLGFSAPRRNVEQVIDLVDALLAAPVDDSPFFEPASRSDDETFRGDLRKVVEDHARPAVARYVEFLRDEYLPRAREMTGVDANPDGEACYRAAIRFYTSLPLSPEEIHQRGLDEMARIQAEMRDIAERSFGRSDVLALLADLREDPEYTFRNEDEVVAYAQAAIDRAEALLPEWFGFVPKAEVVIRPFPAYLKRSGGGFYSAGAVDGSRPGTYEIGTHNPTSITRVGMEATAFHEAWPGHHLQVSVGLERAGVHPVLRYFFFSGTGEGWALYTERLADEMGIYSSDADRLGMLSNEAWRAARLVVDPAMHALGWTRAQGLEYLMQNTALAEGEATYEIDRYLAVPAQATSYMTGSLEIQRLRKLAEERQGDAFDLKAFHDRVIEDGTVTLGMLREKMERWAETAAGDTASAP